MAEQPTDKQKLAQEKRDLARRAKRLALFQPEHEAARLTQFAAELEQEADVLERSAASISLPPVAAAIQPVQQRQVQQQQSVASDPAPTDRDATKE
jgi:hypothetical protein